jgi:hypothetical protein
LKALSKPAYHSSQIGVNKRASSELGKPHDGTHTTGMESIIVNACRVEGIHARSESSRGTRVSADDFARYIVGLHKILARPNGSQNEVLLLCMVA